MTSDQVPVPRITVLAGVNGSGKSSLMGRLLLEKGVLFFNPDDFTKKLILHNPDLSPEEANSTAWTYGKECLVKAILQRSSYAFETTLGANTIPALIAEAAGSGLEVVIWYCGLESPELNMKRVAARVSKGGHDIPEKKIRERWETSRGNLIKLLPLVSEVKVYDNSYEAKKEDGYIPKPVLLLHLKLGRIEFLVPDLPVWAKPIALAARLMAGEA